MDPRELVERSEQIKAKARELGFDGCGIAKAAYLEAEAVKLKDWLSQGMQAGMQYMANHFDLRVDPRKLVPGAKSVIAVIMNYYPEEEQIEGAPILAKYAYGQDYHFVLKDRLKKLHAFIDDQIQLSNGRSFVDSAPVMDKVWAARAGLGWIGKNSNLISPEIGSFVFIGTIILDLDLWYDSPIRDFCGSCNKCIQACPTLAIRPPKVVDAKKCISYQTIENKDDTIDAAIQDKMNNRVFGCDICQDVCPWNRRSKPHKIPDFSPHPDLMAMTREAWHAMDEERFRKLFKGSAVKRAKFKGIRRNLAAIDTKRI